MKLLLLLIMVEKPKDSFHIACIAHRTRLQNILRSPRIDPIEKALLKQRFANMSTVQKGYIEKQKNALSVNFADTVGRIEKAE